MRKTGQTHFPILWWPRPHRKQPQKPPHLSRCSETGPIHLPHTHKPFPSPHQPGWVPDFSLPFRKGRGDTVQSPVLSLTRSVRALRQHGDTQCAGDRQRTQATHEGPHRLLRSSAGTSTLRALARGWGTGGPTGHPPHANPIMQRPQRDTGWEKNEFTGPSHREIALCAATFQ